MARMGHASADASLRYFKAAENRDREIATSIDGRLKQSLGERPSPTRAASSTTSRGTRNGRQSSRS